MAADEAQADQAAQEAQAIKVKQVSALLLANLCRRNCFNFLISKKSNLKFRIIKSVKGFSFVCL